uniref:WGS project CAEQ00000000 data, annotated contig 1109 n=1 Tax=Trypanosoma congolense (strain IL3000) TaxID=1068625 RepID=F9W3U1_TRYCI|nr:unnamed protein product [Trypanosoma congolense IL3000]
MIFRHNNVSLSQSRHELLALENKSSCGIVSASNSCNFVTTFRVILVRCFTYLSRIKGSDRPPVSGSNFFLESLSGNSAANNCGDSNGALSGDAFVHGPISDAQTPASCTIGPIRLEYVALGPSESRTHLLDQGEVTRKFPSFLASSGEYT